MIFGNLFDLLEKLLYLQPRIFYGIMFNTLNNTKLTTNAWINWKENWNDIRFRR